MGGRHGKSVERYEISPSAQVIQEVLTNQPFGSLAYIRCFQDFAHEKGQQDCRQLLSWVLQGLGFPRELSGEQEQLAALLQRFEPDLPPHHRFWSRFSDVVSRAFPNQTMSNRSDLLARQIHQLRYVFSAQQVDWVRRCYGGEGSTDREALVAYLASSDQKDNWLEWLELNAYDYELTYDLTESARLHNKRGQVLSQPTALPIFPDGQEQVNLKILINWHSELILSNHHQFVELCDGTKQGVVNGASFNYASRRGQRHSELDIAPVAPHDPVFRRRVTRGKTISFRSPNRRWLPWGPLWSSSFFNSHGRYAISGRSCARQVRQLAHGLKKEIKQYRQQLKVNR